MIRIGIATSLSLATGPILYGRTTPEAGKSPGKETGLAENAAEKILAVKIRQTHARELLGKFYSSVAGSGEGVQPDDLERFIEGQFNAHLPNVWRFRSRKIAQTLIQEARKHHFDPIFLLAVIRNESQFNPSARGEFTEIGLMQVKPSTAQWIAKRSGLLWKGKLSLYNPEFNIRYGAAYLAHLRGKFDHGQLYLAAYNMGDTGVRRAVMKKIWPKDYAVRVMGYYVSFYKDLARFAAPAATAVAAAKPAPERTVAQATVSGSKLPALELYPATERD